MVRRFFPSVAIGQLDGMDDGESTSESEDGDFTYAALVSRIEANSAREKRHLAASLGELIEDCVPRPGTSSTAATPPASGPPVAPRNFSPTPGPSTVEEDRIRDNILRVIHPQICFSLGHGLFRKRVVTV